MALVNPNIALSYRPTELQLPNLGANFARVQQVRGAVRQNELAQIQLEHARQEQANRNALAERFAPTPEGEPPPLTFEQAARLGKTGLEAFAAQQAGRKGDIERETAGGALVRQALRDLSANPDDTNILGTAARLRESKLFSAQQLTGIDAVASQAIAMPRERRQEFFASQGAPPAAPTSPEVRAKATEEFIAQAKRNIANNPTDEAIAAQVEFLRTRVPLERMVGIQTFANSLIPMPLAQRTTVLLSQGAPARQPGLLTREEEAQRVRIAAAGRTPSDIILMRQLGYPTTPTGYEAFRAAQRQQQAPVVGSMPPDPAQPTAVSPSVDASAATGGSGVFLGAANTVADAFGLNMPAPAVEKATQALNNIRVATITLLQEAVPGRPSNYLMKQLEQLAVKPGSLFQSDQRALERLNQTRNMLNIEVDRVEREVLKNPKAFTNAQVSKSRENHGALRQLRNEYDQLIKTFGGGTSALPPGFVLDPSPIKK